MPGLDYAQTTLDDARRPELGCARRALEVGPLVADGNAEPGPDDPTVVMCLDEFVPLNLRPHSGRQ